MGTAGTEPQVGTGLVCSRKAAGLELNGASDGEDIGEVSRPDRAGPGLDEGSWVCFHCAGKLLQGLNRK